MRHKTWILRLLCNLGLHAWEVEDYWNGDALQKCNTCGLRRWK